MIGWIVAAYLLAVVVILLSDARLSRDELLLVAAWPLTVPVAWLRLAWRRWRTTCRTCGKRYRDHAMMLRHVTREHTGPS